MPTIQYVCPYCLRSESVAADTSRIDQILYGTAWQHVQASHRTEAKALTKMGIRERKEKVASWATKARTTATP